jgi:hypothetical protein
MRFHIGTENEVITPKRHSTFEVSDLADVKQHLTPHGVISQENYKFPGKYDFHFLTLFITA